ncbi:MAG: hypothetical protein AB7T63_07595 [Planctomycetota bacterium]
MGSEIVIAIYRPRRGREAALDALVARHRPALVAAGLVTDRPFVLARSSDGAILEIFEWKDADAAQKAHEHPVVGALWNEMGEVADFPPLADLAESTRRFPHFRPLP